MSEPPTNSDASVPQNTFTNSGINYGVQGNVYGSVQVNNHVIQFNNHALPHDRIGFMQDCGFMQDRLTSFVGRVIEVAEVQRRIVELLPTGGYVIITGQAGQGKSCLIAKLVEQALRERVGEELPITQLVERTGPASLAYHFIPFPPGPDYQVRLLRRLMARLIVKYGLSELYVATDSRPVLCDYFEQVLIEVAAKGGQEVIYLDGLDQIREDPDGERDLSFLPPNPPSGIVFVLGTRPNDTLRPLKLCKPQVLYELPDLSRADFDLILRHHGVALDPHLADRFYQAMQHNALYLDLVARELGQVDAADPEQIIARIADNPDLLFSLTIERLKRKKRLWRKVIKPTLGLLLAVQEPLHLRAVRVLIGRDQDEVREGLECLGGLVRCDKEHFTLFHLKLRDFLRENSAQPERTPLFPVDEEERWHQCLAEWAEEGDGLTAIWQDKVSDELEQVRRKYARQHYITHLCLAKRWSRLWEVLDAGEYAAAKLRHDPSTRSLVLDLDLVRQQMVAAMQEDHEKGLAWLPRLWRYSLLRCTLSGHVDFYPDGLIEVFTQLGKEKEALALAEGVTDPARKAGLLARIGLLLSNSGKQKMSESAIARSVDIAVHQRDIVQKYQAILAIAKVKSNIVPYKETTSNSHLIYEKEAKFGILLGITQLLIQDDFCEEAKTLIQEVIDTARLLDDRDDYLNALVATLKPLCQLEQNDLAKNIAREVFENSREYNAHQRIEMLLDLADSLNDIHLHNESLALLQRIGLLLYQIEDGQYLISYTIRLVRTMIETKKYDDVFHFVECIFDDFSDIISYSGCYTSIYSWSRLYVVEILSQDSQYEQAISIANSISDTYVKALSFVTIANILTQKGNVIHTAVLLQQSIELSKHIKQNDELTHLLFLITSLFVQLENEGVIIDVASSLYTSVMKIERTDKQLSLLVETIWMLLPLQHLQSVNRLIRDVEKSAIQLTRRFTNTLHYDEAFRSLVNSFIDRQLFDIAIVVAHQIKDPSLQHNELDLIDKLRINPISVKSVYTDSKSENDVSKEKIFNAQLDTAPPLDIEAQLDDYSYDEIIDILDNTSDIKRKDSVIFRIITVLIESNRFEDAYQIASHVSDHNLRLDALACISKSLIGQKQIGKAVSIAESIIELEVSNRKHRNNEWFIYTKSIEEMVKEQHPLAEIVDTLLCFHEYQSALRIANSTNEIWVKVRLYADIVKYSVNNHMDVISIFDDIKDRIVRLRVFIESCDCLNVNERRIYMMGLTPRMINEAVHIIDQDERHDILQGIIGIFLDSGWREEAVFLAEDVQNPVDSYWMFSPIIWSYTQSEDWQRVDKLLKNTFKLVWKAGDQQMELLQHIVERISKLLHQPTVLALVQQQWGTSLHYSSLLALLPAAAPLIAAHPPLLQELLDGFDWVDQILKKW